MWRVLKIPPHCPTSCVSFFRRMNSSTPGGREVGITHCPLELSCVCLAVLYSLPNSQLSWASEKQAWVGPEWKCLLTAQGREGAVTAGWALATALTPRLCSIVWSRLAANGSVGLIQCRLWRVGGETHLWVSEEAHSGSESSLRNRKEKKKRCPTACLLSSP